LPSDAVISELYFDIEGVRNRSPRQPIATSGNSPNGHGYDSEMTIGVGQTFAGYTILRCLGAGGMGEVFLAEHPRLPRQDALKLLTTGVSADLNFRERFLREANLASTLWHPHIVGVLDRGEYDGQLWIAMDFVDGDDARTLIAQQYPTGMPQDLVVAIISAVGSALDYAHKKGLLHRDVKPANILLTNPDDTVQRRILLTDFGIARNIDDRDGLTQTNMTVGTVDYAAPEQLTGATLDGSADQYALAVTAYELLTGTPPFRDSNPAVVIGRHLSATAPALADTRPELAAFDHVLARALAKDPSQRYASCSDFAHAFAEQALHASAVPTLSTLPTPPQPDERSDVPTWAASRATQAQAPNPLSPGWYQDPSGSLGMLYWDGRGWHSAPLPKADPQTTASGETSVVRVALFGVIGLVLTLAIVGSILLIWSRNRSPQPAAELPATAATPVGPAAAPPLTPATTSLAATTTPARTSVAAPLPPQNASFDAVIVGTCDEGGTCGVKQRVAPYNEAPRLFPDALEDGTLVTVVCQTVGDPRSSRGHGSSSVWYRLFNGAYVNAVYLDFQGSGVPTC
jgi:serine/threonine-protein kinase